MPTDRKHKTVQDLRRAIHIFGPEGYDTKIAAIQCCHAHGLDPYYRHAQWPKVSPELGLGLTVAEPIAIESIEEWQRMIRRVQSRT